MVDAQTEARAIARYFVGDIYWWVEYGRPLSTLGSSEIGEFVFYTDHVAALAAERAAREAAEAQLAEALKALDEAEFWLEGALTCKTWNWDADQHEAATGSLERIRAARRVLEGGKSDG